METVFVSTRVYLPLPFNLNHLLEADGGGKISHTDVWVIKLYNTHTHTQTHVSLHLVANRTEYITE